MLGCPVELEIEIVEAEVEVDEIGLIPYNKVVLYWLLTIRELFVLVIIKQAEVGHPELLGGKPRDNWRIGSSRRRKIRNAFLPKGNYKRSKNFAFIPQSCFKVSSFFESIEVK